MAEAAKQTAPGTQKENQSQVVLEERRGNVAVIRLNRPDKLNALNIELGRGLVHALLHASQDSFGKSSRRYGRRSRLLRGWRPGADPRSSKAQRER